MLDKYLTELNKLLTGISIVLFVLIIVTGVFTFMAGHPIIAVFELIIVLVAIAANITIICKNNRYIEKWNAINEIEQTSFHYDAPDGIQVMKEGVGSLDFKFNKD